MEDVYSLIQEDSPVQNQFLVLVLSPVLCCDLKLMAISDIRGLFVFRDCLLPLTFYPTSLHRLYHIDETRPRWEDWRSLNYNTYSSLDAFLSRLSNRWENTQKPQKRGSKKTLVSLSLSKLNKTTETHTACSPSQSSSPNNSFQFKLMFLAERQ